MDERADAVLAFWFGAPGQDTAPFIARWFKSDPTFDEEIRSLFGDDVERALRGDYDSWSHGPKGRESDAAALIVILDQFTRNIFRATKEAFRGDSRALEISLEVQASHRDREMTLFQRYFVQMPMMHADDKAVQARSMEAFAALAADGRTEKAPAAAQKILSGAYDYSQRHARIVERFGRFPHRNAMLGRESTPAEIEFLKEPGSSF